VRGWADQAPSFASSKPTQADFTRSELRQLAKNGWAVASVAPAVRAAMIAEIDGLAV
jgi:hypothetical protein